MGLGVYSLHVKKLTLHAGCWNEENEGHRRKGSYAREEGLEKLLTYEHVDGKRSKCYGCVLCDMLLQEISHTTYLFSLLVRS